MKWLTFCLLTIFSAQTWAVNAASEVLNTGDEALNAQLTKLNQQQQRKIKHFAAAISREYMLPDYDIENMIINYKFTPADIFLAVAIADLTGQPVNVVSRAFMEHNKGWKFTLKQLNILSSPKQLKQLHRDVASFIK